MSRFMIAFLVALGAATWIYTRLQRNSGNNTQSSAIGAGVVGLIAFIIVFSILGMIAS